MSSGFKRCQVPLLHDEMYQMSADRPKQWIAAILQRFDKLLALSVTQNTDLSTELESHKECLISISQSKCSFVISGLTCSLKKLSSIRIYGERQEYNLYTSQIVVLNLLEKCIAMKESALPEDCMLIKQLLPEICQFLHQSVPDKLVLSQLQSSASRVLYAISQNNLNIVFSRISARLNDLSSHPDDFADLSDLDLIKHVHLDFKILIKLLQEFVLKFKNLRKSAQLLLVSNFDAALRNWLSSYPAELNQLYKPDLTGSNQNQPRSSSDSGSASTTQEQERRTSAEDLDARHRHLASAAEKFFNILETLTEGSKKKASPCWPIQTVMLVLCPKIVEGIVRNSGHSKSTKYDFFNNLKKSLSTSSPRQVQENCVESFVRVLKAATCVAPGDADSEKTALHQLTDNILPELQTFLFKNGSKHFSKSTERETLIDFFVSNFRLHPDDGDLPRFCASSSSTINHKMVLVQSLCVISTQPCLAWWPRFTALHGYGSDIRTIFKDCTDKVPTQTQTSPRSGQLSLREKMERMNVGLKRSQDGAPTIRELLCVILQLIQGDPALLLHNLGASPQEIHANMLDLGHHVVSLFSVQSTPNLHLSFETLGALLRLHDPQIIPLWCPESSAQNFWEFSSNIATPVCEKLLTNQMLSSNEVTLHTIKWLREVLVCRIEFLMRNHDRTMTGSKSDTVKRALFKLEMTLLEHLWHPCEEVVIVTLSCFRTLFEEAELRCSLDELGIDRLTSGRHDVYQDLSAAAVLSDKETVHDKVRAVLRHLTKFPTASVEAWEDTLVKWETRTHALNYKQTKDDFVSPVATGDGSSNIKSGTKRQAPTKEDVTEWTHMTGFLCSLGGVCSKTVDAVSNTLSSLAWDRRASNSSVNSGSTVPSSPTTGGATDFLSHSRAPPGGKNILSAAHASRFLGHLTNMLANHNARNVEIAVAIRDLLASCLHPALYPTLFQQMSLTLKTNLFHDSGKITKNQSSNLFIDNVIHILHNIFMVCSEQDGDYLGEESIEMLILYLVRYIRHLGTKVSSFPLRISFCKMITEMMGRRSDFFFLSEIKFRNKLVEHVADWVMASSNQNIEVDKNLLREMDVSAVIAISSLINYLPLHPDEGDGGDVPQAKSQLFLKYFTLFMRLLSECADEADDSDVIADDVTSVERGVSLRKCVVMAMSNLLSANIEYGFVHAMGLAYHSDVQTRAAFLEVLIKILQQGTAGFDTLGDTVSDERYERLVELVTMMGDNGELPIANALANVVHTSYMDELARVFVTLFDAKHLLYQLLWNMFTKEVEEADSVQMFIRGNSLASKILTFCFKVYGASYLHNLVEPLVAWSLSPEIADLKFDVDQKRLPPGVDILQCRTNLQRLTERFFTRIMTSTDKFPPQLKSVCHCLYQVVSQRFHESGTEAVASAIFLRFLNPSIVTPYECGLCEQPIPDNLARAFKFMCKLMQNIANHALFTKEEHMKHFNEFVKARFDVCQQFFMQISTPECAAIDGMVHSMSFMNESNVQALHRLLWNNQEKIGQYFAKCRNAKAVGRRPFDKMVTLLAYLGPPEYTRPVFETRLTSQNMTPCKFEELMTKRKVTDSEEYKMVKGLNIFYQFGRSKMGYPVFYYIARRYINSDIREDILMYYILLALKPYSARRFDVIIDLTHVESKNGFRSQYLPKWLVLYTPMIYKNLDTVYVYNSNTWVRDYIKYHQATFDQIKQTQKVRFIGHLTELQDFIEVDHQKVPSATSSLNEDVTVYHNAYRLSGHIKVDIKLGSRAVQFTTVEKTKLLSHDVALNDIYYSHEIESIQAASDSNTFCLKVASSNSVIMFSHPEALKIAQGLRHIRARWELTQPEQDISTHHKIDAKDVPGTLLSMALLNLGCSNAMIRSSAYNLLCAITSTFNLKLDGELCESDGLCIPANNTLFIATLSQTLAKNEEHLTLEFLDECITGFPCLNDTLKNLCLVYMEPWLFNLASFVTSDAAKRAKVKSIIRKLIELTIAEKDFYPSVQIKIWGNLGKMATLIDVILEAFIDTSSQGGHGSMKAEVMADTSVSLSAHNMKLVSSKLITRLCSIVDKTSLRPTPTLEKHKHWDEIAILARFLLMLSFNNNLDVATQLPYLFHLVTLLLSTGPLSLRASIHGLVINIIHSLLTCNQPEFKEDTRRVFRLALAELCLPKFYQYFGISNVKSAADTAFKADTFSHDQVLSAANSTTSLTAQNDVAAIGHSCQATNSDVVNLSYLEVVCDALLEVMEACVRDAAGCDWLSEWLELSQKLAFQYNPSIQPRAVVVLGCVSKKATLRHVKKILGIMGRSLESQADPLLLESTLLALTRLQLVCGANIGLKMSFFWLAISALQMNEGSLYSAGLSLLEQNLHHLDQTEAFNSQLFSLCLTKGRTVVERFVQPLDVAVGISFQSNFHFAFVNHLAKGFRHADPLVISRVVRVLEFSLELISRHRTCHKYEINHDSLPYIAALLPVCDEVRRHCLARKKPGSTTTSHDSTTSSKLSNGHDIAAPPSGQRTIDDVGNCSDAPSNYSISSRSRHSSTLEADATTSSGHRVSSSDVRHHNGSKLSLKMTKRLDSRDSGMTPPKIRKVSELAHDSDSSTSSGSHMTSSSVRSSRRKHSLDLSSNVLFSEEVLDMQSQALLLTLLATQVKHSPKNLDVQILFEYLAEASSIYPSMFPIVYSLLDRKINGILKHSDDGGVMAHVQTIVHNAATYNEDELVLRQLSYLQDIGFGGVCRFAGPFAKVACLENASVVVKLIDGLTNHFLGDVPDLTPVPSRQSLNSALSAAILDASDSEFSDMENDDVMEVTSATTCQDSNDVQTLDRAPKNGSFRDKGPKLTIKLP